MLDKTITFVIIGIVALFGNWIGYDVSPIDALPGMLIILADYYIGLIFQKLLCFHLKFQVVIGIGHRLTYYIGYFSMGRKAVVNATTKINFMALGDTDFSLCWTFVW